MLFKQLNELRNNKSFKSEEVDIKIESKDEHFQNSDLNAQDEVDTLQSIVQQKELQIANLRKKLETNHLFTNKIREIIFKKDESTNQKISELKNLIKADTTKSETDFSVQINEIHQAFYEKMKSQFSSLTNNDLKLCAYIKFGYSAKEIADQLHIKPSSVYISRSRLRKKLDLNNEDDLFSFLNSI